MIEWLDIYIYIYVGLMMHDVGMA